MRPNNPTASVLEMLAWFVMAAVILAPLTGCGRRSGLDYWFVDSLVKVFPDDPAGAHRLPEARFDAARNSHLSIQLALRAENQAVGDLYVDALPLKGPGYPIESVRARWVEYVVVTSNTEKTPPDELRRASLRERV